MNIPLTQITFPERQRKTYNDLEALQKSISTYGILEPILVDSNYNLIAGGRRYTAAKALNLIEVPVRILDSLTDAQKQEIELEENVQRSDLTWQERVCAVAKIHELRSRNAALSGDEWGYEQTGALIGRAKSNVWYCVTVSDAIQKQDKDIIACASLADAIKLLIARKEQDTQELLARLHNSQAKIVQLNTKRYDDKGNVYTGTVPLCDVDGKPCYGWDLDNNPVLTLPTTALPSDVELSAVDELLSPSTTNDEQLTRLQQCCFLSTPDAIAPSCPRIDHIYCDPPYAIDMDNIQQDGVGMNIDITRAEHQVADNMTLLHRFLERAWELLPETGFCVFWYDLDMHASLQLKATHLGFRVQRWPLIWVKTHTCQNGAATFNFTKSTEVCMVLRKPKAVLVRHCPTNYWMGGTDKQANGAIHPFWKPLALHKWILDSIAFKGQTVLDPFAGEGSIPVACCINGLNPVAFECNPELYPRLSNRLLSYL